MKINLKSYDKYTKNYFIKGSDAHRVYKSMVDRYKDQCISGQPPLFVESTKSVKIICREFRFKYRNYYIKCLPADNPSLLTFGFVVYFDDENGKEHVMMVSIPLCFLRKETFGLPLKEKDSFLDDFRNSILNIFSN